MASFEIRVPTYRRPSLLTRALNSLLAQEESDWIAFVYDDSPDREAEGVVSTFNDKRIHYLSNSRKLGAAGNIDQAFRKQPMSDARFFAILEDDNLLLTHFLKRGREIAERSACSLIQMNQLVVDANGLSQKAERTTRGEWFKQGMIEPITLYGSLFLMEGISNGGLFWSRDSVTDLEVGSEMRETCLQEACRTLKITEPIFFESEVCAAWSNLPPAKVVRQSGASRVISRGQAEIRRYLWGHGRAILDEALRFAQDVGREDSLKSCLELSLRPWDGAGIGRRNWRLRFRSMVRAQVTENPVAAFLAGKPGSFQPSVVSPKHFESADCLSR